MNTAMKLILTGSLVLNTHLTASLADQNAFGRSQGKGLMAPKNPCSSLLGIIEENRSNDAQVAVVHLANVLMQNGLAREEALTLAEMIRDPNNQGLSSEDIIKNYERARADLQASPQRNSPSPSATDPRLADGFTAPLFSQLEEMRKIPYDGAKTFTILILRNWGLPYEDARVLAGMLHSPSFKGLSSKQIIAKFEKMRSAIQSSPQRSQPIKLFDLLHDETTAE